MKKNDWIVASINNPQFSVEDFVDVGMNLDNTQILQMDDYLKSNFITNNNAFKNKLGEFDKEKFEDFYKKLLYTFELFKTNEGNEFEYSFFDTRRDINSKVRDSEFLLNYIPNPDHITYGLIERNTQGKRKHTVSELAQKQKIYDPETDSFLDYSPNDHALINSPIEWIKDLFKDPLVVATYDGGEEYVDLFTGEKKIAEKGQYKLNSEGEYYTEKLNGRSTIGKEVISAFDTLTVDGEGINKYDFFDTDSLDKSAIGTIFNTAISIAPLFLGPEIAATYSGILIARELSKTAPMLYGMLGSLFGLEDSATLNTIAAVGQKYSKGTSEYSKENMITFENTANLIKDVALQFGQLKTIVKSILKLQRSKKALESAHIKAYTDYQVKRASIESQVKMGTVPSSALDYIGDTEKWMDSPLGKASLQKYVTPVTKAAEKASRIGSDMALAYMALVSNTDVYESMLEHGTTKKEASVVTLGSMLGMFAVDKYLHLGEVFFDDLTSDALRAMRNVTKKEVQSWSKTLTDITLNNTLDDKSKVSKLFNKGVLMGKSIVGKYWDDLQYHSTGFFGKAVGEGLEEVSEELVSDISKQLYEFAQDFGLNTSTDDVGAFENMLSRYGMSFFGGALGGGLFYGVELVNGKNFHRDITDDELIYMIRNGKTKDLLSQLNAERKKGKLGSTTLSASKYEEDENGNKVWLTSTSKEDTQNEFIYKQIRDTILQLDNIINENQANFTEDELYTQMVLAETRFMNLKNYLQDESYTTGYLQLYLNTLQNLVKIEKDIVLALKTLEGLPNGTVLSDTKERYLTPEEEERKNENLLKLNEKRELLKLELSDFKNGNRSLYYTRKMLFALDSNINEAFVSMTYPQWLKQNKSKTIQELSPEESKVFSAEYRLYKKKSLENNLSNTFNKFLEVEKKITPYLADIQNNQDKFKEYLEKINKLFEKDSPLYVKYLDYDSKLDDESEEEFTNRNLLSPDEIKIRQSKINSLNNIKFNETINQILNLIDSSGGYIDSITKRKLLQFIGRNKQTILEESFNSVFKFIPNTGTRNAKIINDLILKELKNIDPNLHNIAEVNNRIIRQIQDIINKEEEEINIFEDTVKERLLDLEWEGKFQYNHNKNPFDNLFDYIEILKAAGFSEDEIWKVDYNDESLVFDAMRFEDESEIDEQDLINLVSDLRNGVIFNKNKLEDYDIFLRLVMNDLYHNNELQLLIRLDMDTKDINPVISLVKNIGISLDTNTKNIEDILNFISENMWSKDSLLDFQLDDDLKKDFDEAEQFIKMLLSYLYAASTKSNLGNPIGHNVTVNEFASNHSDIFKNFTPLATISEDVANMYIIELTKYLEEMDILKQLSDINLINKELQFINAEINFNKSKYDFFKINKDVFKINIKGHTIDLLENFDSIPEGSLDTLEGLITINNIENLFYDNLNNALKLGISYKEILSEILPKIISNFDNVLKLTTCELNDKINYSEWTDYDKVMYLFTISALKSEDFNTFLKTRIKEELNLAPLTIQEYITRVGLALVVGHDIINLGLEYIQEVTKTSLSILNHFVFIDGIAGAGKTSVIIKNIFKFVNDDNIWLTAPEETQRQSLKETIVHGWVKEKHELLSEILEPSIYTEIKSDIENESKKSKYFSIKQGAGLDNTPIAVVDFDKLTFKLENTPKLIIIDEVTHFSNIELQIINEYARINKIAIIAAGDSNQNGYNKLGLNIDREVCLTIRPPKLSISLRDVNIQKLENLRTILFLLNKLQHIEGKTGLPIHDHELKTIKNLVGNLYFKIYNQDIINGDLITSKLTDDIAKKLTGEVCYIGNTNSPTYDILKNAQVDLISLTEEQVQGREFDYIVIDKNWNKDLSKLSDFELLQYLLSLYTLMSRGKSGSIFIDNGLSDNIGINKEELHTALAPSILNSVLKFREYKLAILNRLNHSQELPNLNLSNLQILLNLNLSNLQELPKILPEDLSLIEEKSETPIEEILERVKEELNESDLLNIDELQESLKEIKIDKPLPIRVYSATSFSGFLRQESEDEIVYIRKPSNIKRELEVFTDKEKLRSSEIDLVVSDLLIFKSIILYTKDWEDLPENIAEIISKENFEKIEYKIEVRPKSDTDNFIGYSQLDKDKLEINGFVYSLVATFENNNGEKCLITLGSLANPETWKKRLPLLLELIAVKIDRSKDIEERKTLEEYKNKGLPEKVFAYELLILNLANLYNNLKDKKPLYVNVSPLFSGLTYLRRVDNNGERLEDIPLDSEEGKNFLKSNPYLVTSDIYVYTGNIPGVKDSVRGKAVMFVSKDTTLSPSELPELYLEEKNATAESKNKNPFNLEVKPSVRMVVLNNRGVPFWTLSSSKYTNIYTTKSGGLYNVFPFELDYMGARMLIAAWNFRVNLINFEKLLKIFKEENNFTTELLNNILDAEARIFQLEKDTESILKAKGVTLEQIDKVKKFNDSLANKVRLFRLGDHRMIRSLTNISKDNIFYGNIDNPMGIYLNDSEVYKYLDIINGIFKSIIDPFIELKDENDIWSLDRLISPNENKKNSLSGLLNTILSSNNQLLITNEDGSISTLNFPDFKVTKFIPVLFVKLFNHMVHYQRKDEDEAKSNLKYKLGDEWIKLDYEYLRNTVTLNFDEGGPLEDTSFIDVLYLMFHGTTEDYTKGNVPQATDAYFKHGFFVDPMCSDEKIELNNILLFKKCITNKLLFSVNVAVDMPVFDITLSNSNTENNKPLENSIKKISLAEQISNKFNLNLADIDGYSEEELLDLVKLKLANRIDDAFNLRDLNVIVEVSINNGVLFTKTLKEVIEKTQDIIIPEDSKKYNLILENGNLELSLENVDRYYVISKELNNTIKINSIEVVKTSLENNSKIEESSIDKGDIEYWRNYLNKEDVKSYLSLLIENYASDKYESFYENLNNYNLDGLKKVIENLYLIVSEEIEDEELDQLGDIYFLINSINLCKL